jgi:hypothetical protein
VGASSSSTPSGTSSGDVDASTSSSGSPAESTGALAPCADYDGDCPPWCEGVHAYVSGGSECVDQGPVRAVCIEPGRELAGDYASAWWKEIEGQPFVVMAGHACLQQVLHEPLDWAECTGAEEEPSACRCLCHGDTCTGEDEAVFAESCDAPIVCPPAPGFLKGGIQPETRCVFEGWRDRVPGRYDLIFDGANDSTRFRMLVAVDGSVQVSRQMQYLIGCPSPLNGLWSPTQTCELASPRLFGECAAAERLTAECEADSTTLAGWISNCVEQPLVCE